MSYCIQRAITAASTSTPLELPGLERMLRQPPSYGFLGNHCWIDEARQLAR
jgi:hypothetical protein